MTKKKFNYSKSLNEIEEIVKSIDSGELDVDVLIKKVKRATILIKECIKINFHYIIYSLLPFIGLSISQQWDTIKNSSYYNEC